MDLQMARQLNEMNAAFYERVSASFSATRQMPWEGWRRLLDYIDLGENRTLRVLDLACGNLRFERFLADEGVELQVWAVDNCDQLVALGRNDGAQTLRLATVSYQHLDVLEVLLAGATLTDQLNVPPCDLSVSFGFMHHVALPEHRQAILRALVGCTRSGGLIALSFWQFTRDQRLLAKAEPLEGGDEGDYLLGWQNEREAYRYCHSFSEAEIDALAQSCAGLAHEVARYSADGKTGTLNRYLLLRRE